MSRSCGGSPIRVRSYHEGSLTIPHLSRFTTISGRWQSGVTCLVIAAGAACGDDEPGPLTNGSTTATVEFVYAAPTTTDPAVAAAFPECVQGVGQTHLHAGWRSFASRAMQAVGPDRWEITYTDVPIGTEERIRVSDPNTCAENPTGASTEGVTANGVLLTRVVDTPGSGIEPGLAFTVAADGTVTP